MLGRLTERRSSALQNLFAAGALMERPSPSGVNVTEDTSACGCLPCTPVCG
jgi:hypothetical protein